MQTNPSHKYIIIPAFNTLHLTAPTSFCNIRISRFLYFKATCFSEKSIIFVFLSVLWKALLNQTDKDDDMGDGCVPSNNRKTRKKRKITGSQWTGSHPEGLGTVQY